MLQDLHLHLTPKRQASIYASGLLAIISLGSLSLLMICLACLWLAIQLVLLLFTTLVASCTVLSSTFAHSPDLVKLLILCALLFCLVKGAQKVWRA